MPMDMDEIRRRNNNLRNPPKYALGMDDDDDDDDDFGGGGSTASGFSMSSRYSRPFEDDFKSMPSSTSSGMPGSSSFTGGGFNNSSMPGSGGGFTSGPTTSAGGPSPFGMMGSGNPVSPGSLPGMNRGPMNNQQPKSVEDQFWDAATKVGHTGKSFFEAMKEAFNGKNYVSLVQASYKMIWASIVLAVVSLVFMCLHLFLPVFNNWFGMLIGSLLSGTTGLVCLGLWLDKSKDEIRAQKASQFPSFHEPAPQQPIRPSFDSSFSLSDDDEDEDEDVDAEEFNFSNFISDDDEDDEEDADDMSVDTTISVEDKVSNAMEDMPLYTPHTQTRACLYEQFMRVLPRFKPNYNEFVPLDEDSKEFNILQEALNQQCELAEIDALDFPQIEDVSYNNFLYKFTFKTKLSKIISKKDAIATDIAAIFAYEMDKQDCGMYGSAKKIGMTIEIKIFRGSDSDVMISLGDMMANVKDKILDPGIELPVFYGINEEGQVNLVDFANEESLIIAGASRSGKTVSAACQTTQLYMFNSPRDLVVEIMDPKGATSNYRKMVANIPHIRVLRTRPLDILDRLRYLTSEEKERREKILMQNNVTSIKDLHKFCPEVEMPWLYILIDEMATIATRLQNIDAQEKTKYLQEYNNLLQIISTQLPNLGIRCIYMPHRVVKDIIPTTIRENTSTKMGVRASKKDLDTFFGIKEKDFKYSLTKPGDMAVLSNGVNNGIAVYNHGPLLTKSEVEDENIYKYIGYVWSRFEPDFKVHTEQITRAALIDGDIVDVRYDVPMRQNTNLVEQTPVNDQTLFSKKIEDAVSESDDDFDGDEDFYL